MHFAYVAAALIPVAFASPLALEARADAASTVLQDLMTLNADAVTLNNTLNGFADSAQPTGTQTLTIQEQSNKISKDIQASTKAATGSTAFNTTESGTIYNYIKNTLEGTTISLLQNFINHEPGFKAAGLNADTKKALTSQKALVQKQASALTAKSQQPYKGEGPAITNAIIAQFNKAISAFS